MPAKLTRKLSLARERRERWKFDIRLTQCDGLGDLHDQNNLGGVESEVCVQMARHAKVVRSSCTIRSYQAYSRRHVLYMQLCHPLPRQGGGQPVRRRRRRQCELGGGRCALARVHAQAA